MHAPRPDRQPRPDHPRFRNPVLGRAEDVDRGDPFVLKYLDTYYLYHTTSDGREGVNVHTSSDLVHWEAQGVALEPAGSDHWAQTDLWAPEVMYQDGIFYMYVSATRLARGSEDARQLGGAEVGAGVDALRRQGLARATNPLGPFVWDDAPLVPDEWTIDGHPLRDQDGTLWLIYNTRQLIYSHEPGREFLAAQTGNVIDQLVAPDQLLGKPTIVSFPSEEWEGNGDFYWNEGAYVIKRGGRYLLLYSGGCYRDSTYGVGLMGARHPRGPWIKHRLNPVLRSSEHISGPGHPSVALAPDNVTPYIVYHGYLKDSETRKIHLDRLRWSGEMPVLGRPYGQPTATDQVLPPHPVHDPEVPYWHADFWVRATWYEVAGVLVRPPNEHYHRVQARQELDRLRVWCDDALVHDGPPVEEFSLRHDGEVQALAITSCLEDSRVHALQPHEDLFWEWGGSTPLELSIAVRGTCYIRFGISEVKVEHSSDRFQIFRINAEYAQHLKVRAGDEPVSVTDLFIAARELDFVNPYRDIPSI